MELRDKTFDPLYPTLMYLSRNLARAAELVSLIRSRGTKQASQYGRFRRQFSNTTCQDFTRCTLTSVAVVMASSVVKRIPLIRFPARMKTPATPPAASAPAPASSALGAESRTPPSSGVDAVGSSRPLHSNMPSQKPPAGGIA